MVGMLMIPKTIAYILMAYAAYKKFFKKAAASKLKMKLNI
jgi:hypothetical protein